MGEDQWDFLFLELAHERHCYPRHRHISLVPLSFPVKNSEMLYYGTPRNCLTRDNNGLNSYASRFANKWQFASSLGVCHRSWRRKLVWHAFGFIFIIVVCFIMLSSHPKSRIEKHVIFQIVSLWLKRGQHVCNTWGPVSGPWTSCWPPLVYRMNGPNSYAEPIHLLWNRCLDNQIWRCRLRRNQWSEKWTLPLHGHQWRYLRIGESRIHLSDYLASFRHVTSE